MHGRNVKTKLLLYSWQKIQNQDKRNINSAMISDSLFVDTNKVVFNNRQLFSIL